MICYAQISPNLFSLLNIITIIINTEHEDICAKHHAETTYGGGCGVYVQLIVDET